MLLYRFYCLEMLLDNLDKCKGGMFQIHINRINVISMCQ